MNCFMVDILIFYKRILNKLSKNNKFLTKNILIKILQSFII